MWEAERHKQQQKRSKLQRAFTLMGLLQAVSLTTTKQMPWKPQGSVNVARWRELIDQPLVAIGGLTLENGPAILEAGADSLAVITAITLAENPLDETGKWLALFI